MAKQPLISQSTLPKHQRSRKQVRRLEKRKKLKYGRKDLEHKPMDAPRMVLTKTQYLALKDARDRAHKAFDPIWSKTQLFTRTTAYFQLSLKMGISSKNTHISMFNIEQCEHVIRIADEIKRQYNIT